VTRFFWSASIAARIWTWIGRRKSEKELPVLGGAGKEIVDRDLLAQRGVRICLQGHQPFAAAVRALHDSARATEGTPGKIETIASDELMNASLATRLRALDQRLA